MREANAFCEQAGAEVAPQSHTGRSVSEPFLYSPSMSKANKTTTGWGSGRPLPLCVGVKGRALADKLGSACERNPKSSKSFGKLFGTVLGAIPSRCGFVGGERSAHELPPISPPSYPQVLPGMIPK